MNFDFFLEFRILRQSNVEEFEFETATLGFKTVSKIFFKIFKFSKTVKFTHETP